jgi:hypothetical protein
MVTGEGVARISLGGFAIGLCGAAPGFRALRNVAGPPSVSRALTTVVVERRSAVSRNRPCHVL